MHSFQNIKNQFTRSCLKPVYLLFLYVQVLSLNGFAQKPPLKFEQLGANSGLSESNVLCILQDSRGFMWFGTGDGLVKYDGYSFTTYKNDRKDPNSISNNFIQGIAESKTGDLWIATLGGGVCKYDRHKEKFIRYQSDLSNTNTPVLDDINTVLEDSEGKVWIGTSDGLDRLDPQTNQFTHYRHSENDPASLSDNYIRHIFEDSDHNIWLSTMKGGLNLFDRKTGTFTSFRHSRLDSKSISSDAVYTVFEDSKRRLWIGTNEDGLNLFDKEKKQFHSFKHTDAARNSLSNNSIRGIEEDHEQKLWIATENGGVNVFDPVRRTFYHYFNDEHDVASLASNSVNTLFKDRKGNMWVGTFNAGINLVDIDAGKFRHYRHVLSSNSLSNNKVLCIYEDSRKNIWIGTDGGGLNVFDPRTGQFTSYRHEENNKNSISGNNVLSVCEDDKGDIWIGTWGEGITVFNPYKQTFKHFRNDPYNAKSLSSNNAWAIFRDKQNQIWVGTYGGGLNLYDPSTATFTTFQPDEKNEHAISDNWINSIYEDSDGDLWVCTSGGGLNLLNRKNYNFSHFQPEAGKNSIIHSNINSISEDRHKNLWIATTAGLNYYNKKTGKFISYTSANGLPGNMIFGILEDEQGNLWISTDKGLSCFNPSTLAFKNYTTADGLQSDKFKEQAFCKTENGVMYFGGNNGFNQFVPHTIKTILFEAPLAITDFQLFNKHVPVAKNENDPSPLKESISETKTIELSYRHSFFSFGFASLNYSSPAKNRYAYMLEGFDDNWNEVGTRHTATYTNLDPGTYVFKVKAANNDGTWNKKETRISLVITPPFWRTWWFKIAALLAVIGSVIGIYVVRVNNIKRQKIILQRKVQEQTIQLVHANEEERKARLEANDANEQLEKKNKELEQFAYIASHDLREPLRTTSAFIELFQKQYKGKLDERADIYLSHITQGSNRMRKLIDDLLDYSRISGQREMERVDCNEIVQEVLSDLDTFISESGAKIEVPGLPVIMGHPTGIKQLFQNLVTNGVKFRKKDTIPAIKITAGKCAHEWKFSFADNGIGIEQKHTERIFAIFERLHTRKEYEGTGIGLAHCKKIVELHRGKIWVESTPGKGSTFYFTIPDTVQDSMGELPEALIQQNEIA
jgi:signal transduction histidine kinase/ligand-binding sensor domain-containing protein